MQYSGPLWPASAGLARLRPIRGRHGPLPTGVKKLAGESVILVRGEEARTGLGVEGPVRGRGDVGLGWREGFGGVGRGVRGCRKGSTGVEGRDTGAGEGVRVPESVSETLAFFTKVFTTESTFPTPAGCRPFRRPNPGNRNPCRKRLHSLLKSLLQTQLFRPRQVVGRSGGRVQ